MWPTLWCLGETGTAGSRMCRARCRQVAEENGQHAPGRQAIYNATRQGVQTTSCDGTSLSSYSRAFPSIVYLSVQLSSWGKDSND